MKRDLVIIMLLILSLSLFGMRNLTLQESVELARENNKGLQKAREEVGKYRQEYNNVRGNLFPQISLSGGYQFSHTRLPDSAIPNLPSLVSMLDSTATDNDYLISGYIDDGFSSFLPAKESDEYSLAGSVSLSQVIFMGGKLINGINIAGKLYHLQEKRYWLEEQNLIFNTIDLYYKTKLAVEVAEIQQEALNFANLYFQQVQDMYQEGLVSEYDQLRAELEVQKLEPEVLEADKNARLARESFANHLNLDESDIQLIDDIELPEMEEIDLEVAIEEAMQNRMELELSEIGVNVNKVTLRYEKGNFLPNIGITADYSYFGADEEKIESDDWGSSYTIGIGFSMPLFTGFSNSSKIRKARHSLKQAELDHRSLQEMIELDVRNSYWQLKADLEKINTQNRNVELATKGLDIANARYENQVSNQLEVIDAQLQLKAAKLSYMNARYSALISYKKMLKAMGREL
ncbi:MAG: TolC family protein [Candidatus Cloacimonetes bacterium]|nr:TolC family protein [Candidatus Cloacimonadota bacterium]MCF7814300.1 TolC family protein [Candidatus Cloacimonadota bacterium]MCF7868377.1 TolC family protein [Candidatus Cloacimonadota bacterium]MCF7883857.1 TolC family protein [Candidatus Cloacimonadota bacterium]